MCKEDSIDAIYNYTEETVKAQEASIVRLNNRSNIFIGFGGTILRLTLDLPCSETKTKTIVVILALSTIIVAAIGLMASMQGEVIPPSVLLKKEYLNEDKFTHQYVIIEQYIKLIKEYENLMRRKQVRINIMVVLFCLTVVFYGMGVTEKGDLFINHFLILINNFLPPS